ncbi:hypothetical protein PybrP1_012002 [[Pythium] brassicae (nom. inval.)]|nr:hypothetical protein PybrP1_012002 [[Pythium] brassicae (nom. inval.)]
MDDDNDHRRFSTPATDANFKPGSHSLQQQTLTRSHSAPDARYDFTRHDVGGSIGNGNGNGFNSPPHGFQHELELGRRYRHHHQQQQQQQQFYHRHHHQPLHQHRELLHQYRHARQQQQQSLRHSAAASPPQAPGSLVELLRSHYSSGLELSFGGTRGDGGGGEGGVDDGGGGATAASSANGKRPRYLREADRRDIIHRIDRGEKQAALAKEFGVTRAAICHINKNRVEILARSNRADAMLVLMTTLRRRETQAQEFQVCTERAFRLLLEEALARVPLRVVDVVTPTSSACEGVTTDRASCGVSISEDGFALLQVFRFIQPTSPSGYITLNAAAVRDGVSSDPTLQKVCVPLDLRTHDVFLMEVTCAMGAGACVAIQALLDYGADETTIYFVCLLASAPAVAEIVSRFPAAHIVVGAVDPEVGDDGAICPGFGSFSERYFDSTVVHDSVMGVSADL